MNALDYVLLAIMALAALRCWFRGIVGEVLSTLAVMGGLAAGILFYRPVGSWISTLAPLGGLEVVAGFVASFAVVFIVIKIVERSLRSVLENLHLDALDRVLGFVFGFGEGVLVSALILLALRYQPVVDVERLLEGSFIARALLPLIAANLPDATRSVVPVGSARLPGSSGLRAGTA